MATKTCCKLFLLCYVLSLLCWSESLSCFVGNFDIRGYASLQKLYRAFWNIKHLDNMDNYGTRPALELRGAVVKRRGESDKGERDKAERERRGRVTRRRQLGKRNRGETDKTKADTKQTKCHTHPILRSSPRPLPIRSLALPRHRPHLLPHDPHEHLTPAHTPPRFATHSPQRRRTTAPRRSYTAPCLTTHIAPRARAGLGKCGCFGGDP